MSAQSVVGEESKQEAASTLECDHKSILPSVAQDNKVEVKTNLGSKEESLTSSQSENKKDDSVSDNNLSKELKADLSDKLAGRWTNEEQEKFLEAVKIFGKNWKEVHKYVGTRSATQARSHAQKYFAKLEKDALKKKADNPEGCNTQACTPSNSPQSKPCIVSPIKDSSICSTSKTCKKSSKCLKRLLDYAEEEKEEKAQKIKCLTTSEEKMSVASQTKVEEAQKSNESKVSENLVKESSIDVLRIPGSQRKNSDYDGVMQNMFASMGSLDYATQHTNYLEEEQESCFNRERFWFYEFQSNSPAPIEHEEPLPRFHHKMSAFSDIENYQEIAINV